MSIPGVGPLLALLAASLFFATQTDKFMTGHNWSLIFQQVVVVGTLAIGQTIVILTSGIDLSNGMIMAFGSIIMTSLAVEYGLHPALGSLDWVWRDHAVWPVERLSGGPGTPAPVHRYFGYAQHCLRHDAHLSHDDDLKAASEILFLGNTFDIGETAITYGSIMMIVLYLVMWFVLRETAWGRHVYALGDNPEAARLAGISTTRLLISVYTLAGLFYGIAGLLLVARTKVGDPQAGQTANLDSVTAVVLGGTSLFGGRGNILATLIGALIVGVFRNGLQLMGIPSMYQVLITGILVILAVSVDQLSHRGQQ